MSDHFDNPLGNARNTMRVPRLAQAVDCLFDLRTRLDARNRRLRQAERQLPQQRVLVVGVRVPSRGDALDRIAAELAQSRHQVVISTTEMRDQGKFQNIADAIAAAPRPIADFDWLVITDDDIALPKRFTDRYLAAAEMAGLAISQPAHKFRSYSTYGVTRRRFGSVARRTGFVEIGPLSVLGRETFADLVPFPDCRWDWGIDVIWADIAKKRGWKIGVVDGLPIRHLKPVAATYDRQIAVDEGRDLLRSYNVSLNKSELMRSHGELIRA